MTREQFGGWNLPFEEFEEQAGVATTLPDGDDVPTAQGIVVMAAKVPTPLGTFPGLVFRFDVPGFPTMPSVMLIGDVETIRDGAALVHKAAEAAIRKAAQG